MSNPETNTDLRGKLKRLSELRAFTLQIGIANERHPWMDAAYEEMSTLRDEVVPAYLPLVQELALAGVLSVYTKDEAYDIESVAGDGDITLYLEEEPFMFPAESPENGSKNPDKEAETPLHLTVWTNGNQISE
jgi:hypothetical protein